MRAFEYARPKTAGEAVKLLAERHGEAAALAGGVDLLALMKDGVATPRRLVSLAAIPELGGIAWDPAKGLRIGASTSLDALAADAAVRARYPALARAAGNAAGPQIRNVSSLAGNLCQRPRCWYFRSGFGLLAMRDGRSMVVEGDNRFHAILGNEGPAYFVSPSTLVPVLIVYGAKVHLLGPRGAREVEVERFYRTPKHEGEREIDLAADEIVTEVTLPPGPAGGVASYEVRPRQTLDWSLATAAVRLDLAGGKVTAARVVLGQVAPVPWVAAEAARRLVGQAIDPKLAASAGEAAVAGARPLSRNRYKVQLARVAVARAVLRAAGQEVSA